MDFVLWHCVYNLVLVLDVGIGIHSFHLEFIIKNKYSILLYKNIVAHNWHEKKFSGPVHWDTKLKSALWSGPVQIIKSAIWTSPVTEIQLAVRPEPDKNLLFDFFSFSCQLTCELYGMKRCVGPMKLTVFFAPQETWSWKGGYTGSCRRGSSSRSSMKSSINWCISSQAS